jgi:tetratricopeptide (TPR) repeat protein
LLTIISISVGTLYAILRFGIGGIYFIPQSMIVPIARLSLGQRLINIPEIFLYYLKTFFFPSQLIIMQYWIVKIKDFQNFYFPLFIVFFFLLICLITGISLYKKNSKLLKFFIFFFVWFLLGLIMHLQIFSLDMTVADRWFYFPIVGLIGMIGVVIQSLNPRYLNVKYLTIILWTCAGVVLLTLSVRTIVRNVDWHDNLTLLTHDSKILDNYNLENNIGWDYQQTQDWPDALNHYKKSVALFPFAENLNNLAHTYIMLNDMGQARVIFYKVLDSSDYQPEGYSNQLAFSSYFVLYNYSPEIAKDFISKALIKSPNNGYLWADLAICEYRLGNKSDAIYSANKAKSLISAPAVIYLYNLIISGREIPKNINITWQ